jgi:HlyD family secretion protein
MSTMSAIMTKSKDYYHLHKKLVIYCALGFVILVPAGYYFMGRSSAPKYVTSTVTKGSITAVVQATGTINPLTTVPVGSFVSGTVQYIFADFNTRVSAGQVLAQLDPTIYQAQVETAQGNLDNAKANLADLLATEDAGKATIQEDQANVAKLQADLAYQQASAGRVTDLYNQGVFSKDQYELQNSTLGQSQASLAQGQAQVLQAQAQLQQTIAQVQQARAQVESMEGELKEAETNLKYTTIISPIDGTVVARSIDVGQSVAASLQAPNVFTIAQDLTRMQVYASTDESDTGSIRAGTEATFQVDAFPTQVFKGRISAIRLNAFTVQNVVTYYTIIDFDNPNQQLLPSETAYVTIPTGHADNAIRIPNAALTYTPSLTNAQIQALYKQYNIPAAATSTHVGGWQVVWKLGPNKTPIPVAIVAGITDYLNTQCVQGSVEEGDLLITAEQSTSKSGASGVPGLSTQRPGGAAGGGGGNRGTGR